MAKRKTTTSPRATATRESSDAEETIEVHKGDLVLVFYPVNGPSIEHRSATVRNVHEDGTTIDCTSPTGKGSHWEGVPLREHDNHVPSWSPMPEEPDDEEAG